MLTLRAPSFHVGAGRAFPKTASASDALCRLSVPVAGSFAGAQPRPRARSRAHEVRLTARSESSHRPLACEEPSPLGEKMEERLKASSVVSNPLPASADARGVSASRTRRLAAPDRVARRTVPVTFGHDVRCTVPLGCRTLLRHLCGGTSRLSTRGLTAPRDPSFFGGWARYPPRQRFEQRATGWHTLLRPALRQCAEREPRCISTDFCFPTSSITSTRASCVPSISSRLAPRPFALRLPLRMTEAGGPGVSRRLIRFGGRLRVHARRLLLPCAPDSAVPLALLSLPDATASLVARRPVRRARRDRAGRHPVKGTPTCRSGEPSVASHPRPARVAPSADGGHVSFRLFRGAGVSSLSARVLAHVVPQARRPSPNASKSGEVESVRFSAPNTV